MEIEDVKALLEEKDDNLNWLFPILTLLIICNFFNEPLVIKKSKDEIIKDIDNSDLPNHIKIQIINLLN